MTETTIFCVEICSELMDNVTTQIPTETPDILRKRDEVVFADVMAMSVLLSIGSTAVQMLLFDEATVTVKFPGVAVGVKKMLEESKVPTLTESFVRERTIVVFALVTLTGTLPRKLLL
jgi:hypothetical protein